MKNSSGKYSQLFLSLTQSIEAFLQEISKHRLNDSATEEWTVKDILCHIAFWHDYYAKNYSALAENTKPFIFPSKGGSTRNQEGVNSLSHKPQKYLVSLINNAQASLYKSIVMKEVPQMTYTGSSVYKTEDFLEMIAGHIQRHTLQVRRAK